jgi:hypothetical protein
MKLKLLLSLLLIAAFSFAAAAQSVVITSKKVTYTRPKPAMESKETFVVNYPKVSGVGKTLAAKIENTISYRSVLNLNVAEEKTEIQWLEEADYEVVYNQNGILSINLFMEGSGAYPSSASKTVVVNLKTGARVHPVDVFTNLPELATEVKKRQREEMRAARAEYKTDTENEDFDGSPYFDKANFTVKNLEGFSVDAKGVTFNYDYGFPHVIQALQPDGAYLMTWKELKPFIKRGGLLAKFVR